MTLKESQRISKAERSKYGGLWEQLGFMQSCRVACTVGRKLSQAAWWLLWHCKLLTDMIQQDPTWSNMIHLILLHRAAHGCITSAFLCLPWSQQKLASIADLPHPLEATASSACPMGLETKPFDCSLCATTVEAKLGLNEVYAPKQSPSLMPVPSDLNSNENQLHFAIFLPYSTDISII